MRLFIFDMGNVILDNIEILSTIAKGIGIDEKEIRKDYSIYDMAIMDGYMLTSDYYDHIERKYKVKVEGEPFAEAFKPTVNEFMLDVVDRLRERGNRCVIGSNTCHEHWMISLEMEGLPLSHFDALYASHIMHLSKPETAFFRSIAEAEGFDYSEITFIDDLARNVEAAASLGIETFQYAGAERNALADRFFSKYLI